METAKVDIRKLQALCDRINQTMDALSQVRLSVHGLQHATAVNPALNPALAQLGGYGPWAAGLGQGIGWAQPYGYGMQPVAGVPGISHSSFGQAYSPTWSNPIPAFGVGVGAGSALSPWVGALNPYATLGGPTGGLTHTSPELIEGMVRGNDVFGPLSAARWAQTFPFAFSPIPGFVSVW
jgi:hypothetical protein